MIVIDGYTLTQYPKENRIVIILPQTVDTITNTISPMQKRRVKLTENEEAALLVCVKAMFENDRSKIDEVKE